MAIGICAFPKDAPRVLQQLCAEINLREFDEEDPYHWQVGPDVLSWENGGWEVNGVPVSDAFVVDLLTNTGGVYSPIR